MKTKKHFLYLLIIITSSFFTSCIPENLDPATAKEMICEGKWSVDYYFAGQDKTTAYSDYQFVFLDNGTVVASKGINSINGTWGIARDVRQNEVLWINTQEPDFQDFNDQWIVTQSVKGELVMKGPNSEAHLKKL